jgi:ABC-2 type transport system ATP-binding protein
MILKTHELTKRYGGHTVLDNVELQMEAGSIYGLVGPNGAGKTTLLSIISNLRRPTSGSVTITVNKQEIAVCPDIPEFEPWLTALEVMQLASNLVGRSTTNAQLRKLLESAGLKDSMNRKVGGYSRGMTQRLALATTVVGNPKLVMLDEPCSALDPSGRVEVLDMIARMGSHATVIFSTHILADVQRVCDTIGVLHKGKLLYQGELTTFLQENTEPVCNITLRTDLDKISVALAKSNWVTGVKQLTKNKLQVTSTSADEMERQLIHTLAAVNAQVVSIEPVDSDLEHAFLHLTGGKDKR